MMKQKNAIKEKPYFRVSWRPGAVQCDGLAGGKFGYRLDDRSGASSNGLFAEWVWDGSRLTIRNDRYGFFPLFYSQNEHGMAVSPSLLRLLDIGASTELNETAMAVFLRLGYFLREDTPFKSIRMLPPGARIEWQAGKFLLSSDGPVIPAVQDIGYDEALERFIALFRQSMHRHAPRNAHFAVPLSGGRDSRHVLLELCAQGLPPQACITQRHFLPTPDENAEIAAELCRALDLKHLLVDQPSSPLRSARKKNLMTHLSSGDHTWIMPLVERIQGRWDTLYDGLAGDVLTDDGLPTDVQRRLMAAGRFEELAEDLMGNEGYLPRLLRPEVYRRFNRELATPVIAAELRRYADAPNPFSLFNLYNRTRRKIAVSTFDLFGQSSRVMAPYLDRDLYDFLASLPARMLADGKFHDRAIHLAHPKYAAIRFDSKSQAHEQGTAYFRRYAWEIARYAPMLGGPLLRRPMLAAYIAASLLRPWGNPIIHIGPLSVYLLQLERLIARFKPKTLPCWGALCLMLADALA